MYSSLAISNTLREEEFLEGNVEIFKAICQISSQLNGMFSFPVLILLSSKLVMIVSCAFSFLFSVFNNTSAMDNLSHIMIFTACIEWMRILVIIYSADAHLYYVIHFLSN